MATNGTLTSTLTIAWVVGNTEYNITASKEVANANSPLNFRKVIGIAQENILEVAAAAAQGQITGINYLAIINRDTTNFVTVGYVDTGATAQYQKLPANGGHIVLYSEDIQANATGAVFTGASQQLDFVTVIADVAPAEIEIIVGLV